MNEFLEKIQNLGIEVWLKDGENLGYRAPKGVMNAALISEFKAHKQDLIKHLQQAISIEHDEANKYKPFRLTDMQSAYLRGQQVSNEDLGGMGCVTVLEIAAERIDTNAFETAWHAIITKHPMLQAIINNDGTQTVQEHYELPSLEVHELTACDDVANDNTVSTLRQDLKMLNFGVDVYPLHKFIVCNGETESRIFLVIDMLIADYPSINKILSDIFLFYFDPEQQNVEYHEPISFRDIVVHDENHKDARLEELSKNYWLQKVESTTFNPPELPVMLGKNDKQPEFLRKAYTMPSASWEPFQKHAKTYNVTPSNAVLRVYSEVIKRWSTRKDFCINITTMQRDEQSIELVGDFSSTSLLKIENDGGAFHEEAQNLQRELFNNLEHVRFSGIQVLREVNKRSGMRVVMPIIFTSTIGVVIEKEEVLERRGDLVNIVGGISKTPQVWIDCQLLNDGDGLQINWDYRDNILADGIIDDMFAAFCDTLESLSADNSLWTQKQIVQIQSQHIHEFEAVPNAVSQKNTVPSMTGTENPSTSNSLVTAIIQSIKNNPQDIALVDADSDYTYEQLGTYVAAVVSRFKECNVSAGQRIAIVHNRGILQVASVIASALCGTVSIVCDASLISHFSPDFVFSEEPIEGSEVENIVMTEAEYSDYENVTIDTLSNETMVSGESPAYVIYERHRDSVSEVTVTHGMAMTMLERFSQRYPLTGNDTYLSIADLSTVNGVYDVFASLASGAQLVLAGNNVCPESWCGIIEKHGVTVWSSASSLLGLLVAEAQMVPSKPLQSIRLAIVNGDVSASLVEHARESVADTCEIVNVHEFSVRGIWGACHALGESHATALVDEPLAVIDSNDCLCPRGVDGEIMMRGSELYLKTGLLGYYNHDGNLCVRGTPRRNTRNNGSNIVASHIENVITRITGNNTFVINDKYEENGLLACIEQFSMNALKHECMKHINDIDRELFTEWKNQAVVCALADMLYMFFQADVFTDIEKLYQSEEIFSAVRPQGEFKKSVSRILRALCEENLVCCDVESYQLSPEGGAIDRASEWAKLQKLEDSLVHSQILLDYQKQSGSCVLEQVRGEISGLSLFFPKGNSNIAREAYSENLINKKLNKMTREVIAHALREKKQLKILEFGAGVGGTTTGILEVLPDSQVEYYFTDVSNFFMNTAKQKYSNRNNMFYHVVNFNENFAEQNFNETDFDIILCANCLHNAKNITTVLERIGSLLKDDGEFVFIDATIESKPLLTSLELKGGLDGYTDYRKDNDGIFIEYDYWQEILHNAGYVTHFILPQRHDPLFECGQAVFHCSKIQRCTITDEKILRDMVSAELPSHSVPTEFVGVAQLPVNVNGCVDYHMLDEYRDASLSIAEKSAIADDAVMDSNVISAIENTLQDIWKTLLNVDTVGVDDNFYSMGGDSLLIAQVVTKMKEDMPEVNEFTWDELMEVVLENPSISGMAKKISSRQPGVASTSTHTEVEPAPSIVSRNTSDNRSNIQNITTSSSPNSQKSVIHYKLNREKNTKTTVIFHSGTGRLIDYTFLIDDLKTHFDDEHAIIGFSYGSRDEFVQTHEDELIVTRARMYADELMKLKSEEYELLGYCVGGFLAFEVSKILLENGFNVINTLVVSSHTCRHKVKNQLLMEYAYGRAIGLDLRHAGYHIDDMKLRASLENLLQGESRNVKNSELVRLSGEYNEMGELFAGLIDYSHDERLSRIFDAAAAATFNGDHSTKSMLTILYDIFEHTYKGMMSYRPDGFYAGEMTVLVPEASGLTFYPDIEDDVNWDNLCVGAITTESIDGNHGTCLSEKNYHNVMQRLKLRKV